ncbi:hypothetical protein HHI36_023096 [Cryptolaemus montrouzieri]|uniref:Uncharacterized protein n=1 Tax=Cryptolaemus montrouzieri TaxID=559131 RepID=A0ABD2PFK9_9CUCU
MEKSICETFTNWKGRKESTYSNIFTGYLVAIKVLKGVIVFRINQHITSIQSKYNILDEKSRHKSGQPRGHTAPSTFERRIRRPSLDRNGIFSGVNPVEWIKIHFKSRFKVGTDKKFNVFNTEVSK